MTIGQNISAFAGRRVVDFVPGRVDELDAAGTARDAVAWRLSADYDSSAEDFAGLFDRFLDVVGGGSVLALVIGQWGSAFEEPPPIGTIVAALDRMPRLTALFLGEMTYEECEISWIQQGDLTPLLTACPRLEILRVRGGEGLALTPLRHESLRELAFESGGLPGDVVRAVAACELPALRKLELWLGVDEYGGDTTIEDLAPILGGGGLPALTSLGLRNAELADQVAAALAGAPVVARLSELDLSMGILSDRGAEALLTGQPLTHLRRLDLSHHFISDELADHLRAELPGVEIDLSDGQDEDEGRRYVAVAE
jgi:hypothetical protein